MWPGREVGMRRGGRKEAAETRSRCRPAPPAALGRLRGGAGSQCAGRAAAAAMRSVLPLLCAGAWLLGAPACGASDLSVSPLGRKGVPGPGGLLGAPPEGGLAGPRLEAREDGGAGWGGR